MWNIPEQYEDCLSRKDPNSGVTLIFKKKKYDGWLTASTRNRKEPLYRLWFDDELTLELKRTFLMSYMRSLEGNLSSDKSGDIEEQIPFWEFLDLEFDSLGKVFRLVAYYNQEPSFPELFSRLIGSPALHQIDDELRDKGPKRIHKQGWKHRDELEYELGAQNVIYTLIDTDKKLLYIGEAKDLIKRLSSGHPVISGWNYFRYSVLPGSLASFRVELERMAIRDIAELLNNNKGIDFLSISDYKLVNDKVDKR